jgi:DNA-binding CsgD family transcriptional regulator
MNVHGNSSTRTQRARRPSHANGARKADPKHAPAADGAARRGMVITVGDAEKIFGMTVAAARERHSRLTERQRQVARLMAQGKPNRQIAEELSISPKTLDIHRADVMHKLEADTVARVANTINLLRQADIAGVKG